MVCAATAMAADVYLQREGPVIDRNIGKGLDTLPKILAHNAASFPDQTALREKTLGIWHSLDWAGYHARVRALTLGLIQIGLEKGQVVGLVGDNRVDWVCMQIATHAAGAVSLGLYRDSLAEETGKLINRAGVTVVFAEDEEQVDKLISLGDTIPSVRWIAYSDPRGLRKYDDPRLISIDRLLAIGRSAVETEPRRYDDLVAAGDGEQVAILCTTSGTTSEPKLAMIRAGALVRHCVAYLEVDPHEPGENYVSVLPLPWIMEQVYAIGWGLVARMVVNFVEEAETTMADFREIGPHFVLFPPRLWEQIAADVRARMMDADRFKQRLFDFGLRRGIAALERGKRSWLAELILFKALRDRLGFSNIRSAGTGGAALAPDTFKFFQVMGVPMRQLYGQTEMLGCYAMHRSDGIDIETVGLPFSNADVRILHPDKNGLGEVVARHPNMFAGYFQDDKATAADLRDGWMHTGDAGFFDRKGHLVIIDRIKDIATTSNGDRFSPQYIENKLKFSPYVAEAVILGNQRPYLSAIICIRFPILSKWAEKNSIAFTTYSDLSSKPEVYELLRAEVERVNATLPEFQRISKFLLLYKELDADDGELTRTRKVRRGVIAEKYGTIIDAIYAGQSAIDVDTTITFQDGTRQRIRALLAIASLS